MDRNFEVNHARKRYTPEEIVAKLRQVEVMTAQGGSIADAMKSIGVIEVVQIYGHHGRAPPTIPARNG